MLLEDQRQSTPAQWPLFPPLARARTIRPEDHPDLWVILKGAEEGACPGPVAQILPHLNASDPGAVVMGPALTASNEWVILVDPAQETISASGAYRRALMQAAKKMRRLPLRHVALVGDTNADKYMREMIEGFRVGWFHVSVKPANPPDILVSIGAGLEKTIRHAELASQATCWARYWTEQPANVLTPSAIADMAQAAGQEVGMTVEVLNPERLKELGAGGVLAVGNASVNTPRIVTLRYLPERPPALGIVGKGITFDSGGVSLKPAANLRKQKGDKAGAMAVLAGALAAAQTAPDLPFLIVLPLAENLIGERAYRPGDVITMLDRTRVEVISTDAEGRMVLADGISIARRQHCLRIFSLATLTKSAITSLGYFRAALYSEDEILRRALKKASDQAGELLWPMPLDADYERLLIQSTVADLAHKSDFIGGGSIVAAKFLQHFAVETPYAHVDMSSSFYLDTDMPWANKGYLGTGGRLVYYLLTKALRETEEGSD